MLDVFLIATIVALILLAAVGLDRIVCHVIRRKQYRDWANHRHVMPE